MIYVPVYQRGQPANEAERREALLGFVFSPFRADDFFRGIVTGESAQRYRIQDLRWPETKPENLLHSSTSADGEAPAGCQPRFSATTNLNVAGRPGPSATPVDRRLIWPTAEVGFLTPWPRASSSVFSSSSSPVHKCARAKRTSQRSAKSEMRGQRERRALSRTGGKRERHRFHARPERQCDFDQQSRGVYYRLHAKRTARHEHG